MGRTIPLALLLVAASAAPAEEVGPGLRIAITAVELADVSPESFAVDLFVEAASDRSASIRSLSFHALEANGMPAYIRPLLTPIELRAGASVRLGPFRAHFYYRDLKTLDPLRRLVEDSLVRFEGQTRAEVDLDWIERIALWSRRVVIWRGVDAAVALEVPGGRLKDLSAGALFALAEPVARAGVELRRAHEAWTTGIWDATDGRVAAVRSSYRIRRPGGAPATVESLTTGVLLSPQRLLVPAEALEPWRYDAATAFALKRGELELLPGREVEAWISGAEARPFRGSSGELIVHDGDCETEKAAVRDGKGRMRKVRVCRSGGEQGLASLEIRSPQERVMQPWRHAGGAMDGETELALLRLIREPPAGRRWWVVVRVRGERVGGEIRLSEPVDRSALGSPMLVDGAIAGVVQHEYGGVMLRGTEVRE